MKRQRFNWVVGRNDNSIPRRKFRTYREALRHLAHQPKAAVEAGDYYLDPLRRES